MNLIDFIKENKYMTREHIVDMQNKLEKTINDCEITLAWLQAQLDESDEITTEVTPNAPQ